MRRAGFVLLLAGGACAASTPRPLPEGVTPEAWEASTSTSALRAMSADAAWWRSFDDPVLSDMVSTATEKNLDLKIADARIRAARASRDAEGADLWPQLNGSAGASYGRTQGTWRSGFNLGVDASWEADLFGRIRADERAAASDVLAAEADRAGVQLILGTEVAESYIEYRLRRVQWALALKTSEAQERTVRITRARFEQGTASGFDVERALSALALTRSRIPEAEEAAFAARQRLAVLLAASPEQIARALLEDRPLPDSDPIRVLRTPKEVIARRPDVRAAEWRFHAALARRDSAERLRYPRLTLGGSVGLNSEDIGELFDPVSVVASVAAGLFAPLLDFGRIRAQIDFADARQEEAYLTYEQSVRLALEEAQTAIVFYAQGVLKQRELENARVSAQRAADFARLQYREGTVSLLEVLDAERSLNEAELSWSQATADVSLRLIAIHRTLGG